MVVEKLSVLAEKLIAVIGNEKFNVGDSVGEAEGFEKVLLANFSAEELLGLDVVFIELVKNGITTDKHFLTEKGFNVCNLAAN